jgi:hypothetical protein
MRLNKTDFEIERFGSSCGLRKFLINNEAAAEDDFVDCYDHSPASAPEYGCGNRCADVIEPTPEVLNKYNINNAEYAEIACQLQGELSIGMCSLCA